MMWNLKGKLKIATVAIVILKETHRDWRLVLVA